MRRLESSRRNGAPAFVLGLGSNGLAFVKSLGGRRVPVVAMDSQRRKEMLSRYCVPLVGPDPHSDEATLLHFLQRIGDVLPTRGVLLPTTDAFVLFVSKFSGVLSKQFDFNVADHQTILMLTNKRLQYEYAQQRGVPTPRTAYPKDLPIEQIAKEMSYPCIIKPYFSHLWKKYTDAHAEKRWYKVAEVYSPSELVETYGEMARSNLELMVQEKIEGGDDQFHTLLVYLNRSSEPLAVFTKRKLRQYPVRFGVSSFGISVWDAEAAELGLKFLRRLRFRGISGPEFKRDPKDGRLKLMEFNPRSLATSYHAVASGVDVPYIAYQDSRGEPVEPAMAFREGVKWINFERDFKAFFDYHKSKDLDLGDWLRSYRGERCYAFFSWDDPLPAVVGFLPFLWGELMDRLGRR